MLPIVLTGSIFVAGCAALPPRLHHVAPKAGSTYATAQSFTGAAAQWPGDKWWTAYNDAQLNDLISEALANAPDLREARARILKGQAIASQMGADLLPSVDANGSVLENRQSYNLGLPAPRGWNDTGRATLDINWEIDFWGKNRASLAAATSEVEAARCEEAAARLALSASVASQYANLAMLFADRDAAEDAIGVRARTLTLINERLGNGLENQGAVHRAEAAKATAEGDLAAIDESIALGRDVIAALLGAGPDRGRTLVRPRQLTATAFGLPATVAADLLGRRPDIAAARRRIEAAASRIKVAKASFYPNINLTAFVGLSSLTLGSFAKSGSLVGSAGPAISLPIFDGGRLRGSYREAEADYDLAIAQYDGAVTQALREVADAHVSSLSLIQRLDRAKSAQTSATAAWQVAINRYRGGLATYLDVLTAEDALIANRRSVTDLRARGFVLDVALVRALGGGFRFEQGASS